MGRFKNAIREEISSYDDSEWVGKLGSEDVTLTSRPLTSRDMTTIERKHPGFQGNPTLEPMVDLLIMKAQCDGEAAFDKADKPMLMSLSTDKIGDMFQALFGRQMEQYNETEEDHEARVKNSQKTGGA